MAILKEIFPNTYRLQIPLPLDVETGNVYLFAGKVPALLDTGTKTPEVLEAIRDGMKKAGIKKLERIIATHWHVDHAGAASALADDKTDIYIGSRDYEEWIGFMEEEGYSKLEHWAIQEWGVPEREVQGMLNMVKWLRTFSTIPNKVKLIEDGDILEAGDYQLEAILTPGHSAGHLSFYEKKEKALFSGDLLLPDMVPYPGAWSEGKRVVSGLPSYVESVKRVEKIEANMYYPAHGKPHDNPSERSRQILEQVNHQVEKYQPAESIYAAAARLGNGKQDPSTLFYQLHYVYGWDQLKKLAMIHEKVF